MLLAQIADSCSDCCFLRKKSLTLGVAVQEPWDLAIGHCLTVGVTFFSVCFLALTFSTNKHICHKIDPQKDSQIHPKPGPGPICIDFVGYVFKHRFLLGYGVDFSLMWVIFYVFFQHLFTLVRTSGFSEILSPFHSKTCFSQVHRN